MKGHTRGMLAVALLLLMASSGPAWAKPKGGHGAQSRFDNWGPKYGDHVRAGHGRANLGAVSRGKTRHSRARVARDGATYLPHPAGCPRRAFCGCGASIEVFGHIVRSLWLAANWLKFPRAPAGAGMAAARSGHVMVIRQVMAGGMALVYDANSGGGRTRLHVRSLAGFRIVNPRG